MDTEDATLSLDADEADSIQRLLDTLGSEAARGTGMTAVWRGMRAELSELLRDGLDGVVCPATGVAYLAWLRAGNTLERLEVFASDIQSPRERALDAMAPDAASVRCSVQTVDYAGTASATVERDGAGLTVTIRDVTDQLAARLLLTDAHADELAALLGGPR